MKIYHCLYCISVLESNVNCFLFKTQDIIQSTFYTSIAILTYYIDIAKTQQDCCCHVLVHSKDVPANLQYIIWKNFSLDLKLSSNHITQLVQCLIICISINVFPHMIDHLRSMPVQTEEKPPHFFPNRNALFWMRYQCIFMFLEGCNSHHACLQPWTLYCQDTALLRPAIII